VRVDFTVENLRVSHMYDDFVSINNRRSGIPKKFMSIRKFIGDYRICGRMLSCGRRDTATFRLRIYQDFPLGPKSKSPTPRRVETSHKS